MARILLGVSGGIAAYKALELTRLAIKAGPRACASSRPRRRRASSARPRSPASPAPPCSSPSGSPTRCAAPSRATRCPRTRRSRTSSWSSAPTSSSIAPGDAPTRSPSSPPATPTTCSPRPRSPAARPLIVAPAMNDAMYEHPATQANLATLRERGAIVLEPGTGLARLARRGGRRPPARAARAARRDRARARRAARDLDGLEVLVTAGGTREPIDAVRFVGNRSSGRMGFALADEAAAAAAPTSP